METKVCIVIDTELCTGCGTCVQECPADVISVKDNVLTVIRNELCVQCGHCAAVCPENAIASGITIKDGGFEVSQDVSDEKSQAALLQNKRSVRRFISEKIPRETIDIIIKYGEYAPSAHNLRNRQYYVVTDKSKIEEIEKSIAMKYKGLLRMLNPLVLKLISLFSKDAYAELSEYVLAFRKLVAKEEKGKSPSLRDPACVICVAAPTGSNNSKDDCLAAQHYMMLYAKSIEIESFVSGYAQFPHKRLEAILGVEKKYSIFAVSSFGYSKSRFLREISYQKPITVHV
jgi:NAD-dependent dihydropyrimidine dehydrogenase PreA subunit/nitroreductase